MPATRIFRPASWPILVKLSIDLLLIALIPLALVVWLTSRQSRRELEDSARQNVQLLARSTASRLDQLVIDASRAVSQVCLDPDFIALCSANSPTPQLLAPVQQRLETVVSTNPDFSSIFVTNAGAMGLASTNPRNVGMDFKFRQYCLEALQGKHFVSEVLIGKTSREPGVYFSAPVLAKAGSATTNPATRMSDGGEVVGCVVLKLRGEKLWEIVDAVRIPPNGFAMLIDDGGIVVSHPDKNKLYHSFAPLSSERIKQIDPELRYSQESISSLDMPELQGPLDDQSASGNVMFTMPPEATESSRSQWVAGYAQMNERPWKVAVAQPLRQFELATQELLRSQAKVALAVAGVVGLLALWRARSIVKPLLSLTSAANQLASGDFTARAKQHSDDEIGQLAGAFNRMVPQLQNAVELQNSMALATEVQQALLPQKPPELRKLDVYGHARYCDSTGGDYFDFADILDWPDRNALIAIGDVTGHGIGAALVMCTARAALRSAALTGGSLGKLLSVVNTILTQDADHRLYMTMTLMVIDPDRGRIRFACAAHDPIIIYQPATDRIDQPEDGEIPLGAMPGTEYFEYSVEGLKPGAVIVLGTDGIWEARNAADEMFGKERLQAVIRANATGTAREIAHAIDVSLSGFLAGRAIQDDVTYVVVKLRG